MYFLNVPPVTLLDDRERPPKILKEPRGLYAAKQDLSSWQTVPRWPAESQVLPQRIKHIRSVPGVPEIFYEPTGKEPCPRPLGEDHGMVVFDYMPTSPVNYFRWENVNTIFLYLLFNISKASYFQPMHFPLYSCFWFLFLLWVRKEMQMIHYIGTFFWKKPSEYFVKGKMITGMTPKNFWSL